MNENGTVYFFTGLSGAGKTTLGTLFYSHLKARKPNVVRLDGDLIRPVFCEEIGYTPDDRLKSAKRIFRVCKMLSDQGIDVVVCSISMISEIRQWNRDHIPNYREIYIKVKKETLLKRNQKGLYTSGKNVVGVDLPFDEPQRPNLVVQNDGEETPEVLVRRIEQSLGIWGDRAYESVDFKFRRGEPVGRGNPQASQMYDGTFQQGYDSEPSASPAFRGGHHRDCTDDRPL